MADEHRDPHPDDARETEASLELPSFGLRRRRRSPAPRASEPEPAAPEAPAAPEPTAAEAPPVVPPAAAPTTDDAPTVATPHAAPARPTPPTAPAAPVAPPQPTQPAQPEPASAAPAAHPAAPIAVDPQPTRSRRGRPSLPALPALSGSAAALVTGLLVGLLGVVLTLASTATCEAIRGTSSCGGAGFFVLGAIVLLMVLLGRALLAAWRVRDPGSTAVLAVGLVAVVALTVLIDVILSWAMVVVVPLVSLAAFGVSHWVTTKVAESEAESESADA